MSPSHYCALAVVLFVIGGVGVLVRRNAIVVFMCVELMLNACNLAFVTFARMHGQPRRPGHRVLRDGRRRRRGRRRTGDHHVDLPDPQVRVGRRREPAEVLRQGRRDPALTTLPATGVQHAAVAAARVAPAFGAAVLLLGGRRTDRWGHLLGVRGPAGGVRARPGLLLRAARLPGAERSRRSCTCTPGYRWAGSRSSLGLLLDPLSMCFVLLITGVGSLIHIYSVGYMAHDPDRRRFFAYMNLFVAAMLLLVLADNYLVAVRRLGGRRPGVVPADRVLAVQARPRRSRPRRRSSSTGSVTSASRWRSC